MAKAPAFQLYAADFYMDTASWTATEVGAYFRLLLHEWINGPLPKDNASLARIAGVDHKTMGKFWMQSVGKKFVQNAEGAWENSRLESTRKEQEEYSEKQRINGQIGAEKRWSKVVAEPLAKPEPKHSSSSSSSTSIKTINKTIIVFEDGKFKNIPDALMEKWRQVAPGVSVPDEIKKAELWIISNPEKKRSKWTAFLSNWMVRAQDNFIKYGGKNVRTTTNFSDKRPTLSDRQRAEDEHLAEVAARWEAAQKGSGGDSGGNSPADDVPDFQDPNRTA